MGAIYLHMVLITKCRDEGFPQTEMGKANIIFLNNTSFPKLIVPSVLTCGRHHR